MSTSHSKMASHGTVVEIMEKVESDLVIVAVYRNADSEMIVGRTE
jgi:hypothetical protein